MAHYLHARYAWEHAAAGLSQWGKPVFSLLAAPFALLGPFGMAVFGACCAVLTCLVIIRSLPASDARWAWSVPVLLFAMPVVPGTVAAGLTEPLFGLWSVMIVAALFHGRTRTALVLASFLPFVRPEHVVLQPFVVLWVARAGRWRQWPWGLVGVVLYSLASGVFLGRPFAFFQEHHYLGNTIYGEGTALHFVEQLPDITGPWVAALFAITLASLPLLWSRAGADRTELFRRTAMTAGPALGIFALHSYAWWRGDLASMGLLRVMATAAPLAVWAMVLVLAAWCRTGAFATAGRAIPWVLPALFIGVAWPDTIARTGLPLPPDPRHEALLRTVHYVQEQGPGPEGRTWYGDPRIAALLDLDPWDSTSCSSMRSFRPHAGQPFLGSGDVVVWDAHFAAFEGRAVADSLFLDPRLRPVHVSFADPPVQVFGSEWYRLDVFRAVPTPQRIQVDTLLPGPSDLWIPIAADTVQLAAGEFPLTLADLPPPPPDALSAAYVLEGELLDTGPVYFVVNGEQDGLRTWPVPTGAFRVVAHLPLPSEQRSQAVYLHCPGPEHTTRFRGLRLLLRTVRLR